VPPAPPAPSAPAPPMPPAPPASPMPPAIPVPSMPSVPSVQKRKPRRKAASLPKVAAPPINSYELHRHTVRHGPRKRHWPRKRHAARPQSGEFLPPGSREAVVAAAQRAAVEAVERSEAEIAAARRAAVEAVERAADIAARANAATQLRTENYNLIADSTLLSIETNNGEQLGRALLESHRDSVEQRELLTAMHLSSWSLDDAVAAASVREIDDSIGLLSLDAAVAAAAAGESEDETDECIFESGVPESKTSEA